MLKSIREDARILNSSTFGEDEVVDGGADDGKQRLDVLYIWTEVIPKQKDCPCQIGSLEAASAIDAW